MTDHGGLVANAHGISRASGWEAFRDRIIVVRGGKCELSGVTTELEAHHMIPFHFGVLLERPWIELDERNIFVLSCGPSVNLHLLLGHLKLFQSYNLYVKGMGKFAKKTSAEILADQEWMKLKLHRAKTWAEMDDGDKHDLAKLIDHLYPQPKAA